MNSVRWDVALVASVFGLGRCPVAPGTVGSLAGLGVVLLLPIQVVVQAPAVLGVMLLGVWASHQASTMSGAKDPSWIVIDEVAGMLVACFMLPKSWLLLAVAFVGFRVLDITKWPPMRQLERLPGGWGIMLDDVAAGLIVRVLLLPWAPLW